MKKNVFLFFCSTMFVFQLSGQNDFREKILKSVNEMRTKGFNCSGTVMPPVAKLTWNVQLETASTLHAKDMAQNSYFSHVSRNGNEVDTRVSAAGYEWSFVGENIAQGYDEIAPVMQGWKGSYAHCVQLMSAEVTEVGAAQYGTYWVMDFAKPLK